MKKVHLYLASLMLVLAIADLPYSYYTVLRVFIAIVVCIHLFTDTLGWKHPVNLAFLFIGILFNPVFKISLDKEVWQWIDLMTAIFFVYTARIPQGTGKRLKPFAG